MSGRRRRDDGWDDGRLDAQDDRRDPWADDSIGEWGGHDADLAEEADRPRTSTGTAGAYVRNAPANGKAYAAPDFPSFKVADAAPGSDRYGNGSAHGGQRGPSNGYAPGGYGQDDYRDAGYGGSNGGYQGGGAGRSANYGNGAN